MDGRIEPQCRETEQDTSDHLLSRLLKIAYHACFPCTAISPQNGGAYRGNSSVCLPGGLPSNGTNVTMSVSDGGCRRF